jgi:hypothetical protein
VHTNIRDNFQLFHRSVRHAPVSLQSTLETLTELLRKNHAHESATQVGVEYKDTAHLDDHFRQGMEIFLNEKTVQFGADDGNEGDVIEDNSIISAELELEDIRSL